MAVSRSISLSSNPSLTNSMSRLYSSREAERDSAVLMPNLEAGLGLQTGVEVDWAPGGRMVVLISRVRETWFREILSNTTDRADGLQLPSKATDQWTKELQRKGKLGRTALPCASRKGFDFGICLKE
jgi:hypothetical protein